MKIAMVVPGGVDRSGVDRVIPCLLWLIERLARRHDVHVFATRQDDEPGTWELLGARVHNIGGGTGGTLRRLLRRFGHEQRGTSFDVVHAFFGVCGTYAAVLGWRHRIPVVFHPSGGEFLSLPEVDYGMRQTLLGRIAIRIAIAGADRVTVTSRPMQEMAASFGVTPTRVPLGVALDRWPPRLPVRRDPSRPARLLHIGDIRPVKDQRMLIAAANRLRDAGRAFTLDMVGADTMRGVLQRSPAAARLADVTRWHGVLHREPLRLLVEHADVVLVSSRHEADPIVFLEAAVAGIPTVGTAVGHIAEWAPDAAVAVAIGDHEALARETARLLDDDARRIAIAREAQRRAIAIDADYTAAMFERVYSELVRR